MKNVVTYTPPKMRPLPGTITDVAIREATLPVKIEAARRAIAECEDLPELLRYRDQAEGLAAAVRIMKHVAPEMVRSANEMVADAWRKGGELLAQYSSVPAVLKGPGSKGKRLPSERAKIATSVGITMSDASCLVRIHKAPQHVAYAAAQKSSDLRAAAGFTPVTVAPDSHLLKGAAKLRKSDAYRNIMGAATGHGLGRVAGNLRYIDLEHFKQLQPDERKVVKAKITEIMELLDEMDRLCK